MNNIETMKQWLEALELSHPRFGVGTAIHSRAVATLRQAIEQAQKQEPLFWMYQDKSTHEVQFQKHMRAFVDHSKTYEVPLYGEPLANHELQCVCGAVWCGDEMVHLPNKAPQRKPLTDEEISDCMEMSIQKTCRAIEAKLKEKNGI